MKQFRRFSVALILILSSCFTQGSEDSNLLWLLAGSNPASQHGATHTPGEPDINAPYIPGEPDTKAPYIQSSSPSYHAAYVPLNASISFHFGELIDASTIAVNTAGTDCTGSIAVSHDGFQTCVAFENPNPEGLSGKQSVFLKPTHDLESAKTYAVRVTRDIKDMAGNLLASSFYNTFQTQNMTDSSFTVQCPQKFSRQEYLAAPSQFKINCTVQALSANRIIREVLIVPGFVKRDGSGYTTTTYNGFSDTIFPFYNDTVQEKTFTLYGSKISPSFGLAQTWEANGYLRFGVHVHYKDGDNVSTIIDMLLDYNAPDINGFYYNVTAILNVTPFIPGNGELSKDQWRAWTYAEYAGGNELKSPTQPISGVTFIKLPLVVRPSNPPQEKLYIVLDTTGDGIPDYKWPVLNYDINADGKTVLIFADGERVGNENRTTPVTISVSQG